MLTVERVDDYLRVTGYPDGSDWIFRPPRPPERGYGVAGPAPPTVATISGGFIHPRTCLTTPASRCGLTSSRRRLSELSPSLVRTVISGRRRPPSASEHRSGSHLHEGTR
jgi:hypothetical protein